MIYLKYFQPTNLDLELWTEQHQAEKNDNLWDLNSQPLEQSYKALQLEPHLVNLTRIYQTENNWTNGLNELIGLTSLGQFIIASRLNWTRSCRTHVLRFVHFKFTFVCLVILSALKSLLPAAS